jgi:hypothetical protein
MLQILWLSGKQKKELAEKLIREGDKRSYNEIKADIELQQWTERFKGVGLKK